MGLDPLMSPDATNPNDYVFTVFTVSVFSVGYLSFLTWCGDQRFDTYSLGFLGESPHLSSPSLEVLKLQFNRMLFY